jgi:DNA-binding MarR family transcriptional regulator
MADSKTSTNTMNSDVEITLGVLNAVQENDSLTQRSVARELGIALGLANAYLKRCVKKGYVKVRQIPKNRYAYYLTPQGFAEKSRLTAEYLSQSFDFFRLARTQCEEIFLLCGERGWEKVMLVGVSDLGEIATLCSCKKPLVLVGFVDPGSDAASHAGLPVTNQMDALKAADAALITDLSDPQATFDAASQILPRERVLAPDFLKVSRQLPKLEE